MHELIDRTARLQKMANERIMTDSRLRGSLNDGQASQLLNWGLAQLNRVALQTEGLDDEAAETMVDTQLSVVTRLLRYVSKLTDPANLGSEEEEAWLMESFRASLAEWQAQPVNPILTQQLAGCLRTGDSHIIFQQMMDMLSAEGRATDILNTNRLAVDIGAVAMEQEEE